MIIIIYQDELSSIVISIAILAFSVIAQAYLYYLKVTNFCGY